MNLRFLATIFLSLFVFNSGFCQEAEDILIVPKNFENIFRLFQKAQLTQNFPPPEEVLKEKDALNRFWCYPKKLETAIMSYENFSPWPWHYLETRFKKTYVSEVTRNLLSNWQGRCSYNISSLFQINFVDRHRCIFSGYSGFFMERDDIKLFDQNDLDFRQSIKNSQLTFEEKRLLFVVIFPIALSYYGLYSPENDSRKPVFKPLPQGAVSFHLWLSDFIDDHVRFAGE